jgi:phenylpropionate dioxygenase-like ring-hydroxylating dioxygenase large terminal subunit
MQDNYNECYHCLTAHPDVARTTVTDTYYVVPSPNHYIAHFSEPKPSVLAASDFDTTRFQGRSQTHVFPGGHFSPNPGTGFMHLMRSIPLGPGKTRQEYDVYKLNTPTATDEKHEMMVKFYQKVVEEDFALCEGVQRNLESGAFERGPLHPFHEEGVKAFQGFVVDALREQVEREKERGGEIWDAVPRQGWGGVGEDERREDVEDILRYCGGKAKCDGTSMEDLEW